MPPASRLRALAQLALLQGDIDLTAASRPRRCARLCSLSQFNELDVVSSLPLFLRAHNPVYWAWSLRERRFERFLRAHGPAVHRGFYQPELALIIRK